MSLLTDKKTIICLVTKLGQNVDGSFETFKQGKKIECKKIENFNTEEKLGIEVNSLNLNFKIDIKYLKFFTDQVMILLDKNIYRYKKVNQDKRYFIIILGLN